MNDDPNDASYSPIIPDSGGFNPNAQLPYGCAVDHIKSAMLEFISFLGFVNEQLGTRGIQRLETLLMPANFSSIVGEFVIAGLPKHCPTLVKNRYHNGHPDLIPAGRFPNDSVQHSSEGIEVKASRYMRGWQGHNPEDVWLMVLVFESNRSRDTVDLTGSVSASRILPIPFRFLLVAGAQLQKTDWNFLDGRKQADGR